MTTIDAISLLPPPTTTTAPVVAGMIRPTTTPAAVVIGLLLDDVDECDMSSSRRRYRSSYVRGDGHGRHRTASMADEGGGGGVLLPVVDGFVDVDPPAVEEGRALFVVTHDEKLRPRCTSVSLTFSSLQIIFYDYSDIFL
jgi:hypothetical protein